MKTNSVSLIFPCYNEAKRFEKGLLDQIVEYINADKRISEVIIVDDGSTDNSKEIIQKKYIALSDKLKVIDGQHQGKAFALILGIKAAKSEYVLLSDIDLATPLAESEKLYQFADEGYDMVIGSRNTRREGAPLLRKLMSSGFIRIRSLFINLQGVVDTQCGFKLYKRDRAIDVLNRLLIFKRQHVTTGRVVAASFDLEFLFVATKLHNKIKEVPVLWKHVDTENVNDFIRDGIRTLKDIFLIKYYDLFNKYSTK